MRLFFGLELSADTIMQIADWRDRQFDTDGRPVPPANFHITLAFIGELGASPRERLCQAVDTALERRNIPGGQLVLDCTGYWPRPGIYWLGPTVCPAPLAQLARKLRNLGTGVGARLDRNPFRPHVTLFRNCRTAPPAPMTIPAFSLKYRHFTLFESRQGKSGVSYHPAEHWDLLPTGP